MLLNYYIGWFRSSISKKKNKKSKWRLVGFFLFFINSEYYLRVNHRLLFPHYFLFIITQLFDAPDYELLTAPLHRDTGIEYKIWKKKTQNK